MARPRVGLRPKLIIASLGLVLAPLVIVWSVGVVEDLIQSQVTGEVDRRTRELVDELGRERPSDAESTERWIQRAAREQHVMLRIVDVDGRIVHETSPSHAERFASLRAWWMGLDDLFFGPPGPPDLLAFDRSLPSLRERTEVQAAFDGRVSGRWRYDEAARMMVYSVAAPLPDDMGVLTVTRVSRRVIRSLYDVRYQLLKLTLFMMGAALLFGLVIGRWMISPIIKMQQRISASLSDPRDVKGNKAAKRGRRERLAQKHKSLALKRDDEIGDLSRAFEELASRLRRQAEETANVAGDLAHDMKNPIATIAATAELLEGSEQLTPERQQRIAAALTNASGHMRRSVDGLLRLARLDATLASRELAPLNFGKLAVDLVDEYTTSPQHEHIHFELNGQEGDCGLIGSPDQLDMLLRSLIDNATLFCTEKVHIDLERAGDRVVVTVSDDGPGVSEGNRDKVFRRFFSSRPAEAPEGSGLGLSIVDAVARARGGSVELLEKGPLPGASFRVTL